MHTLRLYFILFFCVIIITTEYSFGLFAKDANTTPTNKKTLLLVYPTETLITVSENFKGTYLYISGITNHNNIIEILLTGPKTEIFLEEYRPTFFVWHVQQYWKFFVPLYMYFATNNPSNIFNIPHLFVKRHQWAIKNFNTLPYNKRLKYLNVLQKYLIEKKLFSQVTLTTAPINNNLDIFFTKFPLPSNVPIGRYSLTVTVIDYLNSETVAYSTPIFVINSGLVSKLRYFSREYPIFYALTIIIFCLFIGALIPSATSLMLMARSFAKKKDQKKHH